MARRHDEPTEVAEESPEPRLDPETRARRDTALRVVRKHGDPRGQEGMDDREGEDHRRDAGERVGRQASPENLQQFHLEQ